MPEPYEEQLARVHSMAAGNPKWNLSPGDCAALRAVLNRLGELTAFAQDVDARLERLRKLMG